MMKLVFLVRNMVQIVKSKGNKLLQIPFTLMLTSMGILPFTTNGSGITLKYINSEYHL